MPYRERVFDQYGNAAVRPGKRTLGEAFWLYLKDVNKLHLFGLGRVMLLVLAGYAPFAALNDALIPFTFGLPVIDDLEIPIGLLAALKVMIDVYRYRSYSYRPND